MIITREALEKKLEKALLLKNVKFTTITDAVVAGRISRISVDSDTQTGEPMVIFNIQSTRYEVDLIYFADNIEILYGTDYTGERTDVWRVLEEN